MIVGLYVFGAPVTLCGGWFSGLVQPYTDIFTLAGGSADTFTRWQYKSWKCVVQQLVLEHQHIYI